MALGRSIGAGVVLLGAAAAAVACSKSSTTNNTSSGEATSDSGYITETPSSDKDADVTATEVTHKFTGNVADANAGRVIFITHNCIGCHGGLAGGAMGPSLRDTVWKYGGTDQDLYASIHDGRPNGMPAWGKTTSTVGRQQDTLADAQIRQVITYIRSLRTDAEPTFFFWNEQPDSLAGGSATPPTTTSSAGKATRGRPS